MTEETSKPKKTKKPNTPLSEQLFSRQLLRVEALLTQCGDINRQKKILQTLLQAYE